MKSKKLGVFSLSTILIANFCSEIFILWITIYKHDLFKDLEEREEVVFCIGKVKADKKGCEEGEGCSGSCEVHRDDKRFV